MRLDPRIDFQTADKAGIRGKIDARVLKVTADFDRILVTHDRRTMPLHFAAFIQHTQYPGVIVIAQNVPIVVAISELYKIWVDDEHDDYINRIVDVPF